MEKITDKALNGGLGAAAALEQSIEGYIVSAESAAPSKSAPASSGGILGPYGKAIEMLEVNRTSWFSVVTQFNALFQDTLLQPEERSDAHPPSSILSAWVMRQTQKLLSELRVLLPGIEDGASLRAVLEQSLFFSSRMGQVGCDFSGLVLPLFAKVVSDRILESWETSMSHFKIILTTERFVLESEEYSREQVIPLYIRQELNEADDQAAASPMPVRRSGQEDVPAPKGLLAFPPLAYMLNSLLAGLNLLRECPIARYNITFLIYYLCNSIVLHILFWLT